MKLLRKSCCIAFLLLGSMNLFSITPGELMKIDLARDYSSRKISELRLIRSMVFARHGFLLMESELRNYFLKNYNWYDTLVYRNAELEWKGKPVPPVVLTDKEQAFVAKIDSLIHEKCNGNYHETADGMVPALENISNRFEEKDFPGDFKRVLERYGFVIEKANHEQLFHLYDENQYSNTSNFITTDLYLQLMHTYFSYTLKVLEKEKLVPLVTDLTRSLFLESMSYYSTSSDSAIKEMARFNACYFAIACSLISGQDLDPPSAMKSIYQFELEKINSGDDTISLLFGNYIPYSLFIPRGHYTRTEEQKRYFRTMMWLQVAPYCLSDRFLMRNACFNAFILNNSKDLHQRPLRELYNSVYDPIAFLIGDSDNLSIRDICSFYDDHHIDNIDQLEGNEVLDNVRKSLGEKVKTQDKIIPKIKLACHPIINFMPQRYLVDNDILQQFVDTAVNAEKAYPKSLEFLSALGVDKAKDLLYNYYFENKKWPPYDSVMQQQTEKFHSFSNWDQTVYNKWLESLVKLNKPDKCYPFFMQTDGWKLKNLNTSLASWSELKHDAILYGEQPMAAEMGDGGDDLPPPVTVGYVEPNLGFWNTCHEMLLKNDGFLTRYHLKTEELEKKTKEVQDILDFFISASKKELDHQLLTTEEYNRIETISGNFDYLSLDMLNPYFKYGSWYEVTGPDKTIALVADVYTRNVPDCPKDGILHEGTGLGNTIYVVVEIDGHLYLTKGATFSYYELVEKNRLTDEKWQEMLEKGRVTPVEWMNGITVKEVKSEK